VLRRRRAARRRRPGRGQVPRCSRRQAQDGPEAHLRLGQRPVTLTVTSSSSAGASGEAGRGEKPRRADGCRL
jgi:hypothetical protein